MNAPDASIWIEAGFDDDAESWWINPTTARPDDEPDSGRYVCQVPAALYARWTAADDAERGLRRALIDAAGLDHDGGRRLECCPRWTGTISPANTVAAIMLPASGSPDRWPAGARDVMLECCKDRATAEAVIAELPEVFSHAHFHAVSSLIHRADLFIVEHASAECAYTCDRCGWDREDHADAGEATS